MNLSLGIKIGEIMKTIVIDENAFHALKEDEEFVALLILGRMINAIRFFQQAALDNSLQESPPMVRQSLNSFLYVCSTLYEINNWINGNSLRFKHLESWKSGFETLKSDTDYLDFHRRILPRLRNKFTFHFDSKSVSEALKYYNPQKNEIPLISSNSDAHGEHYFELSDILCLSFLFRAADDSEIYEPLEKLIEKSNQFSKKIISCAEKLLGDFFSSLTKKVNRKK